MNNQDFIEVDFTINFEAYRAQLAKVEKETAKTLDSISDKKAKSLFDNIKVEDKLNAIQRKKAESEAKWQQNLRLNSLKQELAQKDVMQKKAEAEVRARLKWQQDLRLNSFKQELAQRNAMQKKADAEAKASFNKTMSGAMANGTTFGHKMYTTASYAAAGAALYGMANAMRAVGKAYLSLDSAITKNAAVLGANVKQATALATANREISIAYGGVIDDIDDVSLILGRAGVKLGDVAAATKLVVQMATVTGDSFADTSKVVSTFTTVFRDAGYQVEKLGGLLAYAANASKMSTEDLGTFSNYGLITAKSLNMTAESVLALATSFSNIGMNASTVGTQIRKFEVIMNSSSAKVQKFWTILGESQKNTMAKIKAGGKEGEDAFVSLVNKIQDMTENDFAEATSGMEILTASFLKNIRVMGGKYEEHLDKLRKGGTLLQIQAAIASTSIEKQFQRFGNSVLTSSSEFLNSVIGNGDAIKNFQDLQKAVEDATYGTEEWKEATINAISAVHKEAKSWSLKAAKEDIFGQSSASYYKEYIPFLADVNRQLDKTVEESIDSLELLSEATRLTFSKGNMSADEFVEVSELIQAELDKLTNKAEQTASKFKAMLVVEDTKFLDDITDLLDDTTTKKIETNLKRLESAATDFSDASSVNNIEEMGEKYKVIQDLTIENVKLNLMAEKELAEEREKNAKKAKTTSDRDAKAYQAHLARMEEYARKLALVNAKEEDKLTTLSKQHSEYYRQNEVLATQVQTYATIEKMAANRVAIAEKEKEIAKEILAIDLQRIRGTLKTDLAKNSANDKTVSLDTNRRENVQSIMKAMEAAEKLAESKEKSKILEELHLQIAKESSEYSRKKFEVDKNFNEELLSMQESSLDMQIELAESTMDWANGLTGVAGQMAAVGTAMNKIQVNELKNIKAKTKLENEYSKKREKFVIEYGELSNEVGALDKEHIKAKDKLQELSTQQQLQGYSQMAGAMSQMFGESSKEAAAFRVVQDGLALSAAVTAIASAGTGDPYTAIPRIIAMTATMVSLLGNIGQTIGVNDVKTSYDSFASVQDNKGTGTSFGMSEKQSESITNSLELMSDFAEPQYRAIVEMKNNIMLLSSNIDKVVNQAIRTNAVYSDYSGSSFSAGNDVAGIGSLADTLFFGQGGFIFDALGDIGIDGNLIANTLIGGVAGFVADAIFGYDLVGDMFGGGGYSKLDDYGAKFNEQLLVGAMDSISANAYQTIFTHKDGGWLSSDSNTYSTKTSELDNTLKENVSMIFANVYDGVILASEAIGMDTLGVTEDLADFMLKEAKISFDKTGEEIEKDFQAFISSNADLIAEDALNGVLDKYRQVGEGLFETLSRVATEVTVVGKLLNTINIMSVNQENILSASQNLIAMSGSLDDFAASTSAYYDYYFTEAEKLIDTQKIINSVFAELNLVAPTTSDEFRNIVEALDLNTESGQKTYITLMQVAGSFEAIDEAIKKSNANIKSFMDSLKTPEQLVADMASTLGVGVATTVDELAAMFNNFAYDLDGLTDSELELLNANKELLLSTEKYQTEIDSLNEVLGETTASIGIIDGVAQNLIATIEKLRAASRTGEQNLQMFYDAMRTALGTDIKDNDMFSKNVADAITKSSALFEQSNFTSMRDMQFAQLVAANQFDSLLETTNTELDYLRMIEENTRAQIEIMTAEMQGYTDSLNSTLLSMIESTKTPAEKIIEAAEQQVNNTLQKGVTITIPTPYGDATYQNLPFGSTAESIIANTGTAGASTLGDLQSVGLNPDLLSTVQNITGINNADFIQRALSEGQDAKLYNEAMANDVTSAEMDAIMGWRAGTANSWAQDRGFPLFYNGGYTGDMPVNSVAGVVHGQEYVVNARTTRDLGLNNSAGVFNEIVAELKALRKENSDMKLYLGKLTSDTSRSLSTERAILDALSA